MTKRLSTRSGDHRKWPHLSQEVLCLTAPLWHNITSIDATGSRYAVTCTTEGSDPNDDDRDGACCVCVSVDGWFLHELGKSPAAHKLHTLNVTRCPRINSSSLKHLLAFSSLRYVGHFIWWSLLCHLIKNVLNVMPG
jgi:hypothetical protein